jgi:hypothetical protein
MATMANDSVNPDIDYVYHLYKVKVVYNNSRANVKCRQQNLQSLEILLYFN